MGKNYHVELTEDKDLLQCKFWLYWQEVKMKYSESAVEIYTINREKNSSPTADPKFPGNTLQ